MAPSMLLGSAVPIGPSVSLKGGRRHFEESTKASRSYSESSAKLLHDGLNTEHGTALSFNGVSADALELEKVRLHRRQNYTSIAK